ncbi:unnamed protein product, partial [Phaeothamnion confervicola]
MSGQSGIQELMAAETRASQIVSEARAGKPTPERHFVCDVIGFCVRRRPRYFFLMHSPLSRSERMKEAKKEAESIINAYRAE